MSLYRHWGKRVLDLSVLLVVSPFVIPLAMIAALAVRVQMGGPVFFRQVRPGYQAKPFTLLKFRTMNSACDEQGNLLADEKRLTKLGARLRRYSVDEIPQLFNVLKGEMSFVGPRPLLMEYLSIYTKAEARRHEVKPGLTGWAQIRGRNSLSWEARFGFDLWYVDHWGLGLDARILLQTIWQVVMRKNIAHDGHATMPAFTRRGPIEP